MKLFFLILSFIVFISCRGNIFSDDQVQFKENIHLNICVLGNSYSNDAFCYVPYILKDYGITCKIHIYYRGSGSLHDLDAQWYDDGAYGIADIDGKEHIRLHFSIDTRICNSWRNEKRMSANDILQLEQWDIVSIQQGGNRAKELDTYYPYLERILAKINSQCDYSFNLAWFMAYNGATENDNEASINAQRKIAEDGHFDMVFPVATSIFMAQSIKELASMGDSIYKNLYSSDNIHLQEGFPCYLAALTISQALLDKYRPGISVLGNKLRPTQDWLTKINPITPNGESVGITEENCFLGQKIAISANIFNYTILTDF